MSSSSCKLRTGRSSEKGNYYLLTSCCRDRIHFFSNPDSAHTVLNSARWLDQQRIIDLIAVVVMPDHMHLVVGLRESSLPEVMHRIKSYTSHVIAQATGVEGGIWQRGFHDRGIDDETALRAQVEYCLLNPVRARLAENFRDYPYWWCCWEV